MSCAYGESYVDDAMKNLGEALDYAVHICGIGIDVFLEMFVTGGTAERFGSGVPDIVSGRSGTELAMCVIENSGCKTDFLPPREDFVITEEYWCGWILALYQWHSGISFKSIIGRINGRTLMLLYPALHEASEEKCIETLEGIMARPSGPTRLQKAREDRGLSQSRLAAISGVNLRTLQQYEIRAKSINRAAAATLRDLSKTLGCRMEDLLEAE